MKKVLINILFLLFCSLVYGQNGGNRNLAYQFSIRGPILPKTVNMVRGCVEEAQRMDASSIVMLIDSFAGVAESADSISGLIMQCDIPVLAFVDGHATGVSALVAISADSIYMSAGSTLGAVMDTEPDRRMDVDGFQSHMRSIMRAVAESHGYVMGTGTDGPALRWRYDPKLAEAMVDRSIYIHSLVDSLTVLTLTAADALKWHYSEATASSVREVLQKAGMGDYEIYEHLPPAFVEMMKRFSTSFLSGLFAAVMIACFYMAFCTCRKRALFFAVAFIAILLYFIPLYVRGIALFWEIMIFFVGLLLLLAGIYVPDIRRRAMLWAGMIFMVIGIIMASVDMPLLKYVNSGELSAWSVLGSVPAVVAGLAVGLGTGGLSCLRTGRRC